VAVLVIDLLERVQLQQKIRENPILHCNTNPTRVL
jgi:hypothetical protein